MAELNTANLLAAIEGDPDSVTIVKFESDTSHKGKDWWSKTTDSLWLAKKDERGAPIVAETKVVTRDNILEDEDYAMYDFDDLAMEQGSEFHYEGGYLADWGYFKIVDSGHLGDGKEAWVMWEHVDSGRLFRRGGYYSSWGESGWDDEIVEVVPAEVKVQRYRPIDGGKPFDYPAVTL